MAAVRPLEKPHTAARSDDVTLAYRTLCKYSHTQYDVWGKHEHPGYAIVFERVSLFTFRYIPTLDSNHRTNF